jgi:regulator of sigma E protease
LDIIATVFSIIGALLVIGIIIMVHELGHFSIGRACKIKVVEFSVGFGPKIKKWVRNDIIYTVRWVLLGGYTKFYGEDEELNDRDAFNRQPAGRRALAIFAGPMFNIIFAFLLVVITLCAFGDYAPIVAEVYEDGPAQAAGLQAGDVIREMNGVEMDFTMEIDAAKRASDNVTMPITVQRGDQMLSFDIPYEYSEEQNAYIVGIGIGGQRETFGIGEAIALSFKWMFLLVKETILAVFGLFAGRGTENAMGVVGMVSYLGAAIRSSVEYVLRLGVAISVSLAVFNLLPLPALDGGRLVFIGIEKLFKKPVPRNVEGAIHLVGFALLIVVFFLITYQDITRMFSG